MGKILQTVAAIAFNFIFWCSGYVHLALGILMHQNLRSDTDFLGIVAYLLITTGGLIILIGAVAGCCAVKMQHTLLYIYGGILVILFVLEIGAGISIYAYKNRLKNGFGNGFIEAMSYYKNDTRLAKDIDVIQSNFYCCGDHAPSDWLTLKPPMDIPASCCMVQNCDTSKASNIYREGCYRLIDFLQSYIGSIAGAAVIISFFPLLGVLLCWYLASVTNKKMYEHMA